MASLLGGLHPQKRQLIPPLLEPLEVRELNELIVLIVLIMPISIHVAIILVPFSPVPLITVRSLTSVFSHLKFILEFQLTLS